MRQRTGVTTLSFIGGLLVLLMITGVACDDSGAKTTGEPTALSPGLTGTATPEPPVTEEPTPSPTPVPRYPILEAAIATMRNIDSFHFVESSKWSVAIVASDRPNAEAIEATGDYQSPDKLRKRAVIHYVHPSTTSHVQAISIGDTRYVTNPDTGEWERSRESVWGEDELFSNPIDFFESVASELGPNAYRGISTLGGVKVHRFVYTAPDLGRTSTIQSLNVVIVVGVRRFPGQGGEEQVQLVPEAMPSRLPVHIGANYSTKTPSTSIGSCTRLTLPISLPNSDFCGHTRFRAR